MRLPTIYRGGGAGFLPSKSIGSLAKVGGKKSHYFLPHQLLSPLFRDLDLIPSGYDLIPSKGGSWCALTRGVGPFPHYPRSCGSPMHVGRTPELSRTFPVQYRKIPNIFRTFGPLWNFPELSGSFPVQYRKKPNFFRRPKQDFAYINLYLRTIPELLVTSGISSGTSNNIR